MPRPLLRIKLKEFLIWDEWQWMNESVRSSSDSQTHTKSSGKNTQVHKHARDSSERSLLGNYFVSRSTCTRVVRCATSRRSRFQCRVPLWKLRDDREREKEKGLERGREKERNVSSSACPRSCVHIYTRFSFFPPQFIAQRRERGTASRGKGDASETHEKRSSRWKIIPVRRAAEIANMQIYTSYISGERKCVDDSSSLTLSRGYTVTRICMNKKEWTLVLDILQDDS